MDINGIERLDHVEMARKWQQCMCNVATTEGIRANAGQKLGEVHSHQVARIVTPLISFAARL
jgi:hypothetical protein